MEQVDWFTILFALTGIPAMFIAAVGLVRGHLAPMAGAWGLILLPSIAFGLANLLLVEEAKQVEFCGSCHVMAPVVASAWKDGDTLAAAHFRGAFPRSEGCYVCHSGYGVWGGFEAKLAGAKHMWASLSGHVAYPISTGGRFDVEGCRKCHAGSDAFERELAHHDPETVRLIDAGELGCAGLCHTPAHPAWALAEPGTQAAPRGGGG